jgi:membrane fusion protein (multidrug efflux system)
MIKKFLIALGGFVVLVLGLGAVKTAQIKKAMSVAHVQPDSSVTTLEAKQVEWKAHIKAIGTLAPVQGVTLSADADGQIVKILVESGAVVKAGDILLEIDATVENAQLAASEAKAGLAKISLDRAQSLLGNNTVAKSEFDVADATYKQAMAEVASIKATIDKKFVRAPFDGRVGIRLVNVGQYISRGVALLPLQKLDPIYVNFSVPQAQLASLAVGQKVALTVDGAPGGFQGEINAINSQVDPATRNVTVQALIANPEEILRAGMFARVEVELPRAESLVVVPATAIAYASYGNSVFIVEKMKDEATGEEYLGVRQQPITVGTARGDLVAISGGVKPGEQVVTSGVFKLRNRVRVQVNNKVQPSSDPAPKPVNT